MSKLTKREKYVVKEAVKTVALYVVAGIAINKALDFYIKH